MATQQQVLEMLEAMRDRLDDPDMEQRMGTFTRSVQFHLTDLELTYLMQVEGGRVTSLEEASLDAPGISVTCDSDVLLGIGTGEVSTVAAFMSGELRVDASFGDILKLQQFFR